MLFTGDDPLIMSARNLAACFRPVLEVPSVQRIHIGPKALSFWPYRFVSEPASPELLALFRRIVHSGRHLALMAHFDHPREMEPDIVHEAIAHVRDTGADIGTQSPLPRGINDDPSVWAESWRTQVNLGCVPYYMFMARDTGAQPCY